MFRYISHTQVDYSARSVEFHGLFFIASLRSPPDNKGLKNIELGDLRSFNFEFGAVCFSENEIENMCALERSDDSNFERLINTAVCLDVGFFARKK